MEWIETYNLWGWRVFSNLAPSPSESATTLLPGQDKLAPSGSMSGEPCVVVSCGVRVSEVGLSEIRKPQVRSMGRRNNPPNFEVEEGTTTVG